MTWRQHVPEAQRKAFRETERQAKASARKEARADKLARARIAHESALERTRDPRRRDEPFLRFVRRCPCLVCATEGRQQAAPTEAAVRRAYPGERGWRPVGGAERPHDFRCLPLCADHHRTGPAAQHSDDCHDWYAGHGVYPPAACAGLMRAHLAGADPAETIERIASDARRTRAQDGR